MSVFRSERRNDSRSEHGLAVFAINRAEVGFVA